MTIASWLVTVHKGRGAAVRRALKSPDVECRSEAYDTLVVVSESPSRPHALDDVQRRLGAVEGVRDVALVARFDDEGDVQRLAPRTPPACAVA